MPTDYEDIDVKKLQWVKSSDYLRVNTCVDNVDKLTGLFNDGPCDVVKSAKESSCGIYVEYPNPGATPTKFSLNERTQYVSTSVGNVKIGSKNLQDCIHYDSAPGLIKVITVCHDAQGNFEGATTYFIQRVSVRNPEDITSADRQDGGTSQDGASQDAASQQTSQQDTQNPQDSTGKDSSQPSTPENGQGSVQSQKGAPKESLVKRDRYGRMIPVSILQRYEAEGDNAGQSSDDTDLEVAVIEKSAQSFLSGKFAQGLLDLTNQYYEAQLLGAASIVSNKRLPWLGRCTFSLGTGTDVNKKPAIRMAILPWDHSTKSNKEDAWECVRTCASAQDLDEDMVDDASKGQKPSGTTTTSPATQAGQATNPLVQAATQGHPQNQIQAQQQIGHIPEEATDDQKRAMLAQQETADPAKYAQSLFSVVSKKFASAAGRDTVSDYKVFCKWRDILYDTTNPEENGLVKVTAADMASKHTNFRGRTKAAQWILF